MRNLSILLTIAVFFVGCSLAPNYVAPANDLPESAVDTLQISDSWWEGFNDPALNKIVLEALEHNRDLEIAAGNTARARAALGLATAQQYPNFAVSGEGARTWAHSDPLNRSKLVDSDRFALSGALSFEVDLWSKLSDSKKSALSQLLAMEATQESIRLSLIGGAIESYYALLALTYNARDIEEMLQGKERAYELRKSQAKAGALTELILSQVAANLNGTRAQLIDAKRQKEAAENAMSVLLGRTPKAIFNDRIAISDRFPFGALPSANLPSDLLLRRPDIRAAEEELKASNYSIGSARAQYLPSISLTGSAGFASAELGDLFDRQSQTARAGIGINLPIFSFGRIGAQVDSAKAAKEIAISQYQKRVATAFSEVKDALSRREQAAERLVRLKEQTTYLRRALKLTREQYEAGYRDYIAVIDAETDLLGAQISLNAAEAENIAAQVELYKALGGGYKPATAE
ncbi:MAG: TolC family protein [Helicobacteraceae bacterium]|jgi:multidrug efflux system outer membrane protein|nr:TolC family protein [Helicobacteraceae bacterium]